MQARLHGFISNSQIDEAKRFENLAGLVTRNLPKKDPVALLVDETSLRDKLKAMVIAVDYEGRGVWRRICGR